MTRTMRLTGSGLITSVLSFFKLNYQAGKRLNERSNNEDLFKIANHFIDSTSTVIVTLLLLLLVLLLYNSADIHQPAVIPLFSSHRITSFPVYLYWPLSNNNIHYH